MAHFICPQISDRSTYHGLEWIFEYTNQDGELTKLNCGQAAAATFLTHHGLMDPVQSKANMEWLERHHPPDQVVGYWGTGRRRMERILRAFQCDVVEVVGEVELCRQLALNNPVILMVGMSSGKLLGFDLPGGHWMVAYGCDSERVYLTNWGTMSWDEVVDGWKKLTARWIRMNGRGLAQRVGK